jgi:hypothetical protein
MFAFDEVVGNKPAQGRREEPPPKRKKRTNEKGHTDNFVNNTSRM